MNRMNRSILFAAALVAGAAAGLTLALLQGADDEIVAATIFDTPRELPALDLVNADGAAVSGNIFTGRWDLLFFGFTHCPDICPATLHRLDALLDTIAQSAPERLPRVWLVSVDPSRDTPAVLADYLGFFDARFGALTGTDESVATLAGALGVAYARLPQGEDYTMSHSAALFLIDPRGHYAGLFNTPHDWDRIGSDLETILQ